MQKLETRWLVMHTQTRTVVVAHRWDNSFHCTCGSSSQCSHIKKVMARVLGTPLPIAKPRQRVRPKFRPIPEQMSMPEFDFVVTRKFR